MPELSTEGSSNVSLYVDALQDVADALGVGDLSFSVYSSVIDRLDHEEVDVNRALLRTQRVEAELTQYLLSIEHESRLIDKWTDSLQTTANTADTVPELERRKAALIAKAKEYQKELGELQAETADIAPVSITELAAFRKQLKKQEHTLKEKRARVEAFQGLPPNIELARHALEEARDRQMELIQLRERLLGKMVDGVI
ncbi:hypothetical protein K466DRAFT_519202 [Polyporus arcularius HHB13444]|uniref:Uncharacterized protein n=1 Tax=Polyporus arcularius HHB13444 TaxID=1314778 RepID=A0A5C3PK48_9APHY|nr:hypothetical protein K466DRAFT_519202 [Polyporus arcularius HHB13444]